MDELLTWSVQAQVAEPYNHEIYKWFEKHPDLRIEIFERALATLPEEWPDRFTSSEVHCVEPTFAGTVRGAVYGNEVEWRIQELALDYLIVVYPVMAWETDVDPVEAGDISMDVAHMAHSAIGRAAKRVAERHDVEPPKEQFNPHIARLEREHGAS